MYCFFFSPSLDTCLLSTIKQSNNTHILTAYFKSSTCFKMKLSIPVLVAAIGLSTTGAAVSAPGGNALLYTHSISTTVLKKTVVLEPRKTVTMTEPGRTITGGTRATGNTTITNVVIGQRTYQLSDLTTKPRVTRTMTDHPTITMTTTITRTSKVTNIVATHSDGTKTWRLAEPTGRA
jgi:hypothetical protein